MGIKYKVKDNFFETWSSEMAYVSARGATLYKCMAICFEENGNKDDRDKKLVRDLDQMSAKYYNVAAVFSAKTGKSDKNFLDQMKTLMEAYANEMAKSKRLNNDYFGSPRLINDQAALKKIQSLIFSLSDGIEASKNKK